MKAVVWMLPVVAVMAAWNGAWGALRPERYMEARRAAEHHVQIEIHKVVVADAMFNNPRTTCTVEGKVISVFKSRNSLLRRGDKVVADLGCYVDHATLCPQADEMERAKCLAAAASYHTGPGLTPEAMGSGRLIEAYLDGAVPSGLKDVMGQYGIISKPTTKPVCSDQVAETVCRER